MTEKLPFLLIIPHGGLDVPEELYGHENVSPINIFFESDAGANPIFSLPDSIYKAISTDISKLFVDVDREYKELSPITHDGVIKSRTSMNLEVFRDNCYPDEIAISNILNRYYRPFHDSIKTAIKEFSFKAIIECHTHSAVGPKNAQDRGKPRPLIITGCTAGTDSGIKHTAPEGMAMELANILSKKLSKEGDTVSDIFRVSNHYSKGFIVRNYIQLELPVLTLSISRSLFLNEPFFDLENMRIDDNRLHAISSLIKSSLEKFYARCF
ncbi:MAG: N-formylglutamate amidohydrolase [Leptospirales bacterium]|nr:N-formylglutamate amidohydrolase [Leptospirales bacterium]